MLQKGRFAQIIGANIKRVRNEKGITQEKLAADCGFYRTYINLIETSRRLPSSYTLYKIARSLKVSVDTLYPSS
jgi:transcriptional regulator with XRE-family HTH domain